MLRKIDVAIAGEASVQVKTTVAFAPEQPQAVAYGTLKPKAGNRIVGDTVNLHAERDTDYVKGGKRLVEVVVNGEVVASQKVEADGKPHDLAFDVPITKSGWVAVSQFPQLHSNPVNVIVVQQPIRANRDSALWCAESVRLLWHNRRQFIAAAEQPEARLAYEAALAKYFQIAEEANTRERVQRFELE